MTSPLTQSACAPRATSEVAASRTADELSTLASINSIPISLQTLRPAFVNAAEFDSAAGTRSPGTVSFQDVLLKSIGPDGLYYFPLQGKLQINPTSEVPARPAEGIELAIEYRVFVRFLGRPCPHVILL